MVTITLHGHACYALEADGRRVIIDPFLMGNPAAAVSPERLPQIDAVLLSHGHRDHLGDAIPIAKRDRHRSSRRSSSPGHASSGVPRCTPCASAGSISSRSAA